MVLILDRIATVRGLGVVALLLLVVAVHVVRPSDGRKTEGCV